MRTLGVALVALACLIGVAGLADVLEPYLDAWGVPLRGSVSPWHVWLAAGLVALAGGAALWRAGDARMRPDQAHNQPDATSEAAEPHVEP